MCLGHDRRALLLLVECWNTIMDVGGSARSFDRKLADLHAVAVTRFPEQETGVRGCWVVRATRRTRWLVARYPEVFATRFPGSSVGWVRALTTGAEPPEEPGLIWCGAAATRLFAWRHR